MDSHEENEDSEENETKTDASDEENLALEICEVDEDFADLPENVVSCLLLNQAYQQDIKHFLAFIVNKMCANRMMQEEIRKNTRTINTVKPTATGSSHPHSTLAFLAPYFKDVKGLHPPLNSDVLQKKHNGEINHASISANKPWTFAEKSSLRESVLQQMKKNYLAPLFRRKEQKISDLRNIEAPEFKRIRRDCETEIEELTQEINSVDSKPLESFVLSRESSCEIDWLVISASLNRSDFQCEIMWKNYLHPSINKSSWKKEEDEQLTQLVQTLGNNWEKISDELGTGRLAWQCLSRYQSELNTQMKRTGPLSKLEAKHVEEVIEQCRIGNFIPWQQVNYFIEGRSSSQIKHYWKKINLPKRGENFTELEDKVLIAAVEKYGSHNWRKVAHFLPGRNNRQCRERYVMRLGVENRKFGSYTPAEDKQILQLAKEHNCKWVEIEKKMLGRNAKQISQRYEYLIKYHKMDDSEGIHSGDSVNLQTPTRRVVLNRRHCKRIKQAMITLYGGQPLDEETEDLDSILKSGSQQLRDELELAMKKKKLSIEGRGRPKKTEDESEVDKEISELFSYYSLYRRRNCSKACQISVQEQYVNEETKKCLSSLINNQIPENTHLLSTVVNRVFESNVTDFDDRNFLKLSPIIPPNRATVRGYQGLLLQRSHLMKQIESQRINHLDSSPLFQTPDYQRLLRTFMSLFIWPSLLSIEYAPQKPACSTESKSVTNERANLYLIRDRQHYLIQSAMNSAQKVSTGSSKNITEQSVAVSAAEESLNSEECYGRGKRRKTESWKKLHAKKPKEQSIK